MLASEDMAVPRRRGRPRSDQTVVRNLRWLQLVSMFGASIEGIAKDERVSGRTVRRGVQAARHYAATRIRVSDEAESEAAERAEHNRCRRRLHTSTQK
jgi:hypothetical protein